MTPMTIPDAAVEAALDAFIKAASTATGDHDACVSAGIRAAIAATLPLSCQVKELAWEKNSQDSIWTGETAFGFYYTIDKDDDGYSVYQGQFLSEYGPKKIAFAATLESAKSAAQADFTRRASSMLEAGEKGPQAEFGHGRLCIDTGTYKSIPAVFVRPAKIGGQVGEKCPEAEHHPLDSLAPGEWFMTFPTDEQSQAVADALCGFLSVPDARTATLEEAARAAEGESPNFDHQEALAECRDCESGFHRGRLAATSAIRSLSGSAPVSVSTDLERAARNLIANRFDTYTARNGRKCTIEGDDGEKCWIVSFDDMADLESALSGSGSGDGWLPLTDGLNAIGYEICGRHVLKLSYENLNQLEAAKAAIQSLLPSAPADGGDLRGMNIALEQSWDSNRERQEKIDRLEDALRNFTDGRDISYVDALEIARSLTGGQQ